MKRIILILVAALMLVGCGAEQVDKTTNDAPALDVYNGQPSPTGQVAVYIGADAPVVQVWCTDLSGIRRQSTFEIVDDTVNAMCEVGGRFTVSVVR